MIPLPFKTSINFFLCAIFPMLCQHDHDAIVYCIRLQPLWHPCRFQFPSASRWFYSSKCVTSIF
uniref:Secreted protein n=1 Tax=Setaria viridis TaxID=4556 RepID=A0A4U6SYL4_SETVI|nr:hypothetical protein SEVIR_9G211433v2 [Setaria viridis]